MAFIGFRLFEPGGALHNPTRYLAKFDLYGEQSRPDVADKLREIWESIPTDGRLEGVLSVAASSSPLAPIATAAAALAEPVLAGDMAYAMMRSTKARVDPFMMGWLVFLGCSSCGDAIERGLALIDTGEEHRQLAGHMVLLFATLWPLAPHPWEYTPSNLPEPVDLASWDELRGRRVDAGA